jgi:phage recombination protein Bet
MNGTFGQITPPFLSEAEIDVLRRTLLKQFTDDEQESFIRQCQRTLLDPFSKQIFATRRWTKDRQGNKTPTLTTVTSIMGLTAIAVRTGQYDGCVTTWAGKDGIWKDEWLEDEYPRAAKCVVYHKQRSHPEVGIARWEGYVGKAFDNATKRWEITDFWERLPDFMLGKVAKAQALRGAFPDQCSSIYISEELQGGVSEADQMDDEAKVAHNRAKEEEIFRQAAASKNVRVVETKPTKRPTAAEAAEPAFPEDAIPAPMSATQPTQAPRPVPPEPPDDLDMGEEAAPTPPEERDAKQPPEGAPVDKSWAMHVITGIKNPKYNGRVVSDLTMQELKAFEAQWIPKVRAVWETVNPLQRADAEAFEARIAHEKTERLW